MSISRSNIACLAVSDFLQVREMEDEVSNGTFDQGLALRKQVLGSDYVENSIANADDFTRPMQLLSTEYCWGTVWARAGLSLRDRSLLNLGMISALNRPHELKLHIRGALRNGLSREEMQEVFLQVAVYCGIPAGMASFQLAREVFAELDSETSTD
jgi:4-carboxymuconolactone decarboxylase